MKQDKVKYELQELSGKPLKKRNKEGEGINAQPVSGQTEHCAALC
ncbi:MAG: hypothetical protein ACLTQG_00445 [Hungatella sp.]